jgi:hypothetical protein
LADARLRVVSYFYNFSVAASGYFAGWGAIRKPRDCCGTDGIAKRKMRVPGRFTGLQTGEPSGQDRNGGYSPFTLPALSGPELKGETDGRPLMVAHGKEVT